MNDTSFWRLAGELVGKRPVRRRRSHWGPGGDTTHLGPDGQRVTPINPDGMADALEERRPDWLPGGARLAGFTADTAGTVTVRTSLWALPDGTVVNEAGGEEFASLAHFQFAVEQTHDTFSVLPPDELSAAAAAFWSQDEDDGTGGWTGEAAWSGAGEG